MSSLLPIFSDFKQNELHIWKLKLPLESGTIFTTLKEYLSNEELAKAKNFYFEVDQNRFVLSRGMLRKLIGAYLAINPTEIKLYYNTYGKPLLIDENLQFNLSHSKDYILIAFSYDSPVGIDIEYCKREIDLLSLANEICTDSEYKILSSLSGQEQCFAFYRCWTRKEAILKARGLGLSFPLKELEVIRSVNETLEIFNTLNNYNTYETRTDNWFLVDLKLIDLKIESKNYMASLSSSKKIENLHYFDAFDLKL